MTHQEQLEEQNHLQSVLRVVNRKLQSCTPSQRTDLLKSKNEVEAALKQLN